MSESSRATAPALADIARTLDSFVDATTEALETAGAPAAARKQVTTAGEDLVEQITAHAERVGDLETKIDELQAELQQERETRAKEAAEDRKRLHEVETRVDDVIDDDATATTTEPDPDGGSPPTNPGVEPPKTPLEEVIRVPAHLVEEHLTANQRRARFVAKDIDEYTQSVPAGRAIRSSQLRQVLTAGEDATIYTETVSRVIRFLDDLGSDAVKVRDSRRGERVIVFDEAFVDRVQAYQSQATPERNTVVTGQGVGG